MTTAVRRRLETGTKVGPQRRYLGLEVRKGKQASDPAVSVPGLNVEARTLELSFSSEAPVARWFGNEVLSHEADAANLDRLNDSAPLLFNHNMDDVIGVVERAWVDGKVGRAVVRFAKTARGDEVMGMVADGILRNVSFMYQASKYRIESDEEDPYYDDDAIYTATRWEAFEISVVSVPADQSIGIGRAAATEERSVEVETPKRAASPAATADSQPPGEDPMILKRTLVPLLMSAALADGAAAGGGAAAAAVVDPIVAERQRYADVTALARKHQVPAETLDKWLAGGTTLHEARGLVLEMKLAGQGGPVASLGEGGLGMSDKEKRSYSVVRAVQALVTGDWKRAGFEREVSAQLQKQVDAQAAELGIERPSSDARGFMVPLDLPFAPDEKHARAWRLAGGERLMSPQLRAPYAVGAPTTGGNIVATNLLADNFIEVLRNASVTAQLGARYLTDLVGKVDIPRQSAAMSVGWVGESVAGAESEATFDKVSLTPKTVTAWSVMSRLMMLQATPAIEMLAREDLLAVCALALDLAALSGTGSGGQPLGVVNQSGVGSVVGGTNGLAVTFDQIIQLKTLPRVANASIANMSFAINSKTKGYLETQKASTGQYLWTEGGYAGSSAAPNLKGERYVESQQLRSTLTKGTSSGICSELIYGNWRELLIAMWGVMEIGVNPYDSAGFKNGDVILRVMQTLDVGVRHGASFAVMSDALTPGF